MVQLRTVGVQLGCRQGAVRDSWGAGGVQLGCEVAAITSQGMSAQPGSGVWLVLVHPLVSLYSWYHQYACSADGGGTRVSLNASFQERFQFPPGHARPPPGLPCRVSKRTPAQRSSVGEQAVRLVAPTAEVKPPSS
jgi:hypothetical protein